MSSGAADRDKEGGPAIGGLKIKITDSTITCARGGSKAAGIGAISDAPVTVEIRGSSVIVYGVSDPDGEAAGLQIYFYDALEKISASTRQ